MSEQADGGADQEHDGRGGQEPRLPGRIAEVFGHHGAGPHLQRRSRGSRRGCRRPRARWRPRRRPTLLIDAVGHGRQLIHPLPAFRIDFRRLAQHHGEDLVARCDFGQVHVRFEADLFEVRHAVRRQGVIQIFGNRVAIEVRRRSVIDGAANRSRRMTSRILWNNSVANLLSSILLPISWESFGSSRPSM